MHVTPAALKDAWISNDIPRFDALCTQAKQHPRQLNALFTALMNTIPVQATGDMVYTLRDTMSRGTEGHIRFMACVSEAGYLQSQWTPEAYAAMQAIMEHHPDYIPGMRIYPMPCPSADLLESIPEYLFTLYQAARDNIPPASPIQVDDDHDIQPFLLPIYIPGAPQAHQDSVLMGITEAINDYLDDHVPKDDDTILFFDSIPHLLPDALLRAYTLQAEVLLDMQWIMDQNPLIESSIGWDRYTIQVDDSDIHVRLYDHVPSMAYVTIPILAAMGNQDAIPLWLRDVAPQAQPVQDTRTVYTPILH